MKWHGLLLIIVLLLVFGNGEAQQSEANFVFGDLLPDAPELAARGDHAVGVRTLTFTNPDQIDILTGDGATYDRVLAVEVWYPAVLAVGEAELVEYDELLSNADEPGPLKPFTFMGRAARDAAPDRTNGPYPLVIVSHGYPGSRFMLTYLNENLASKGYVVAAIDHMESTFGDKADVNSSLLNRAVDQEFVLDQISQLGQSDGFASGLIDANNTALIGYSFGGYGTLNAIGAGYNPLLSMVLGSAIAPRLENDPSYLQSIDPRIKAAVLFAPFGGDLTAYGFAGVSLWSPVAVANITIPTFWVIGSLDDVAFYNAVVELFDNSTNSERYLLTYREARHNVAANPPPPDATTLSEYQRYAEFAWDEGRINNINQHFVTAFLDLYLKGDESMQAYLELDVEVASDGVYSVDGSGNFTATHTYWKGFLPRTAIGLELRRETS